MAVLVSTGILGVGIAPAAAAPPAAATAFSSSSTNLPPASSAIAGAVAPSAAASAVAVQGIEGQMRQSPSSSPSIEPRNRLQAIIQAIRSVPALLSKVVAGARQGLAYFTRNVWPTVRAWVGGIADVVGVWSVWDYFN